MLSLPNEIIYHILKYGDYESIISIYKVSKRFAFLDLLLLLREILKQMTKFTIDTYSKQNMLHLYKILTCKDKIIAGINHSLILKDNGRLYHLENTFDREITEISIVSEINIPGLQNEIIYDIIPQSDQSLILTANKQVYISKFNCQQEHRHIHQQEEEQNYSLTFLLNDCCCISNYSNHSLILTNIGCIYKYNHYHDIRTLIPHLPNAKIIQISRGCGHSLLLSEEGQVYSFGSNYYGQLGHIYISNHNHPELIPSLSDIIQITAGAIHSLALTVTGTIFGFGSNHCGQLALNQSLIYAATLISKLSDIVSISAGNCHSLVLNIYGRVYGFGSNGNGQIDPKNTQNKYTPYLISDLTHIIKISAGISHSLALDDKNRVYVFGYNRWT